MPIRARALSMLLALTALACAQAGAPAPDASGPRVTGVSCDPFAPHPLPMGVVVGGLAERRITSETRKRDGGSIEIRFELAGQPAEAAFPVILVDGGFAAGPATLTLPGTSMALTRQASAPVGAAYLCLRS